MPTHDVPIFEPEQSEQPGQQQQHGQPGQEQQHGELLFTGGSLPPMPPPSTAPLTTDSSWVLPPDPTVSPTHSAVIVAPMEPVSAAEDIASAAEDVAPMDTDVSLAGAVPPSPVGTGGSIGPSAASVSDAAASLLQHGGGHVVASWLVDATGNTIDPPTYRTRGQHGQPGAGAAYDGSGVRYNQCPRCQKREEYPLPMNGICPRCNLQVEDMIEEPRTMVEVPAEPTEQASTVSGANPQVQQQMAEDRLREQAAWQTMEPIPEALPTFTYLPSHPFSDDRGKGDGKGRGTVGAPQQLGQDSPASYGKLRGDAASATAVTCYSVTTQHMVTGEPQASAVSPGQYSLQTVGPGVTQYVMNMPSAPLRTYVQLPSVWETTSCAPTLDALDGTDSVQQASTVSGAAPGALPKAAPVHHGQKGQGGQHAYAPGGVYPTNKGACKGSLGKVSGDVLFGFGGGSKGGKGGQPGQGQSWADQQDDESVQGVNVTAPGWDDQTIGQHPPAAAVPAAGTDTADYLRSQAASGAVPSPGPAAGAAPTPMPSPDGQRGQSQQGGQHGQWQQDDDLWAGWTPGVSAATQDVVGQALGSLNFVPRAPRRPAAQYGVQGTANLRQGCGEPMWFSAAMDGGVEGFKLIVGDIPRIKIGVPGDPQHQPSWDIGEVSGGQRCQHGQLAN